MIWLFDLSVDPQLKKRLHFYKIWNVKVWLFVPFPVCTKKSSKVHTSGTLKEKHQGKQDDCDITDIITKIHRFIYLFFDASLWKVVWMKIRNRKEKKKKSKLRTFSFKVNLGFRTEIKGYRGCPLPPSRPLISTNFHLAPPFPPRPLGAEEGPWGPWSQCDSLGKGPWCPTDPLIWN